VKVKLGSLHCCYAAGVAYRERPRETWSVMRCVYLPRDKFDVFGETDAVWCMFAYCYFRLRRCTPDAGNNSRLSISATNYYVHDVQWQSVSTHRHSERSRSTPKCLLVLLHNAVQPHWCQRTAELMVPECIMRPHIANA